MHSVWRLIPLLYLLRVPLLVCGFQIGLVIAVNFTPRVRSLLGGLFDLQPGGLFIVAALAILLVGVETVGAEIVLRYCQSRFNAPSLPASWEKPFRLGNLSVRTATAWLLLLYLVGALLTIVESVRWSPFSPVWKATLAVGGAGVALALIALTAWLWERTPDALPLQRLLLFLLPGIKGDPAGYLFFHKDADGHLVYEDRLLPGHAFAALLAGVWALVYATLGLIGNPAAAAQWARTLAAPALGSVQILLTVLCLVFGSLAFWLDRYRIPAIAPVLLIVLVASWSSRSDHTFPTTRVDRVERVIPQQVVDATQLPGARGLIVVAASGGGIHSAAWTTTVLAGLTHASSSANPDYGAAAFPRAVRLISSVSGGSVGSLHFAAAYRDGAIPLDRLESSVIQPARASSLNEVAWGLAYPDLLRLALVVPPHLNSGWALQQAWARRADLPPRFSDWRPDVTLGRRPAQIFNSTLVETGERFLMGTVDLPPSQGAADNTRDVSFYALYPKLDLAPVTAARVSSTFPYVTPASRPENVNLEDSYHAVDGGYYDNFGIVSATQFLASALPRPGIDRVLLVQIDDGPPPSADRKASQRGWFFQSFAPVQTLLKVRGASQRARNDLDLQLLEEVLRSRGVTLTIARFSYPREGAPLSWHLTLDEQLEIDQSWKDSRIQSEALKVADFIRKIQQPKP